MLNTLLKKDSLAENHFIPLSRSFLRLQSHAGLGWTFVSIEASSTYHHC